MVAVCVALMFHVTVVPRSDPVLLKDHSLSVVSEMLVGTPTTVTSALPHRRLASAVAVGRGAAMWTAGSIPHAASIVAHNGIARVARVVLRYAAIVFICLTWVDCDTTPPCSCAIRPRDPTSICPH